MKHLSRLFAAAGLCLLAVASSAATLLPNGEQTFVGNNGQPLNGGTVQFYAPNTTIPKDTWQDAGQTVLNTNPVVLDSSGRAIIYGTGAYREVLKDGFGNLIWDQMTGDATASNSSWGATSAGSANSQTVNAANFSSQDGQSISFIAGFTNTTSASLNPNGIGPIGILKDTPSGPTGLSGGEIIASTVETVTYDAGRGAFHLSGTPATPGVETPITAGPTTDLGTVSSHFASVTGSATISSFGSSCSTVAPIYYVQFSGGQTITANSTSLITPGGTNIATAASDTAVAQCLGSGNWQIISYFRAAGNIPPTAVIPFNASACPVGWIPSDGTNGTADLRGEFVRGLDTGGAVDPGRRLASAQQDQLHTFGGTVPSGGPGTVSGGGNLTNGAQFNNAQAVTFSGAAFGSETRPKNVALLYCQKS